MLCCVHLDPGFAEPWGWMAYEATADGVAPRMIAHRRDGRAEARAIAEEGGVSLVHGAFEIEMPPGDESATTEIGAGEFERRRLTARMGSPA